MQAPFSWILPSCPGFFFIIIIKGSTDKEVYNHKEFDLQKDIISVFLPVPTVIQC